MSKGRQRSPFEGDGRGDRKGDETLHIEFVGIRGGHGTSTVAAATALILGAAHAHVALDASDPDSMAALLGCSTPGSRPTILTDTVEFAASAAWTRSEGPRVVVTDLGRLGSPGGGSVKAVAALRVGVLRGPCYLALRTLVAADTVDWAGLVLCAEAGRALDRRDVEDMAGLAVLATIDVTPAVARTLDAGLAVSRLPKMREFAQLRPWLTSLDSRPLIGPDQAAPDAVAFRPEPVEKTCTDWHLPPMAEGAGCRAETRCHSLRTCLAELRAPWGLASKGQHTSELPRRGSADRVRDHATGRSDGGLVGGNSKSSGIWSTCRTILGELGQFVKVLDPSQTGAPD